MNTLTNYMPTFFGTDWINENWRIYLESRSGDTSESFTADSILGEITMHPAMFLCADYQDLTTSEFRFDLVDRDSGNYKILLYLQRDLMLLEKEIMARGDKIKNSLKRVSEYDSTRFCILIAAAYKLLGYKIEFLPEKQNKMPDLLVSSRNTEFVVECKQRNQRLADNKRYEMFVRIVLAVRQQMLSSNLINLSIEIKIKYNRNDILDLVSRDILSSLEKANYEPIIRDDFDVRFFKANSRSYYDRFVNNNSNVNRVVYFTRAENSFLFTDPNSQNIFVVNKHYADDLLPANLYNLILDANEKYKGNNRLVLHFDFGMSDSSWSNIVANKIYKEIEENRTEYNEIDLFVFSQTCPKYVDDQVIFKPDFKTIGRRSKVANLPLNLIVGQQGETGMDNYLDALDS